MLSILISFVAALTLPPKPDHYVTDRAAVLEAARADALNEKLAQFERTTSNQILIVVDQHVPEGTTIEEMGAEAIRQWGVGQKGKDNGAILFLFVADRKIRIEVGYGLEGALTDAKSQRIIEEVLKPELRRGDINSAVERGADAIIAAIRGEPYAGTGQTVAETERASTAPSGRLRLIALMLFVVAAIALFFTARRIGRRLDPDALRLSDVKGPPSERPLAIVSLALLVSLIVISPEPLLDVTGCYLVLLAIAFFVGMLAAFAARSSSRSGVTLSSDGSSTASSSDTSWSSSSSSDWSSSSDSSSSSSADSSSSFSGGGGSGGGGGASGSW